MPRNHLPSVGTCVQRIALPFGSTYTASESPNTTHNRNRVRREITTAASTMRCRSEPSIGSPCRYSRSTTVMLFSVSASPSSHAMIRISAVPCHSGVHRITRYGDGQ